MAKTEREGIDVRTTVRPEVAAAAAVVRDPLDHDGRHGLAV